MSSYSYRSVLKSTSLIGGASLVNIFIGMVRTKSVAVLLGPSGVGLMGIYSSIIGMVSSISSMGIGTSGVRQIAEAQGLADKIKVACIVKTLRRTVWLTGAVGMLIMILGCALFSRASFGNHSHSIPIALLGITILLGNIAVGQACLLQGTRRISAMAKVSVIGALNGTMISIPCFFFWGLQGIVPSLILTSAAALVASWWFARQVFVAPVEMTWSESRGEAVKLLHFGVPLMLAGLTTAVSGYLIPALLVRQFGLPGVGVWRAAFSLSGVLVAFVLSAMSADYYPRLTAVAADNKLLCEEVNAQTEIALLLSMPGLVITIIFAPYVIAIFYSGRFDGAVDILRWSIYGVLGRVISWPLSFIMLAKGMGKTFFYTEAFSNIFYVFAIWVCARVWGLQGTGIAFMLLYVVYVFVVYVVANTISHMSWSHINRVHIIVFGSLLVIVGLVSSLVKSPWYQFPVNFFLLLVVSAYCLRRLSRKSGVTFQTILDKFKMRYADK